MHDVCEAWGFSAVISFSAGLGVLLSLQIKFGGRLVVNLHSELTCWFVWFE